MIHPNTQRILLERQIADEAEILMTTGREFVARLQAQRIADLLHQRRQIKTDSPATPTRAHTQVRPYINHLIHP